VWILEVVWAEIAIFGVPAGIGGRWADRNILSRLKLQPIAAGKKKIEKISNF